MWNWRNQAQDRREMGNYLANSLKACPDQCCQTWVKLAEIHRKAGNRAEFEILAGRLKETYDIILPEWQTHQ